MSVSAQKNNHKSICVKKEYNIQLSRQLRRLLNYLTIKSTLSGVDERFSKKRKPIQQELGDCEVKQDISSFTYLNLQQLTRSDVLSVKNLLDYLSTC